MEEYRYRDSRKSTFRWLSTWSLSFLFHVFILLILTLILDPIPQPGVESETTVDVGIALKSTVDEKTVYESMEESGDSQETESSEAMPVESTSENTTLAELSPWTTADEPLEIPSLDAALPGRPVTEGVEKGGLPRVSEGLSGIGGGVSAGTLGKFGRGKVSCFQTTGEGSRFSFVFDRSGSMGGQGFNPLMAAKAELVRALQSLQPNQQFQIIFYNEQPLIFSTRLLLATDPNRREALRFLGAVSADGGTDHKAALHMAISSHPDVLFFLTDADEPPLTARELQEIRLNAAGTQINTIQFGHGPRAASSNFLMKLAEQNHGQYIYIDIRTLDNSKE